MATSVATAARASGIATNNSAGWACIVHTARRATERRSPSRLPGRSLTVASSSAKVRALSAAATRCSSSRTAKRPSADALRRRSMICSRSASDALRVPRLATLCSRLARRGLRGNRLGVPCREDHDGGHGNGSADAHRPARCRVALCKQVYADSQPTRSEESSAARSSSVPDVFEYPLERGAVASPRAANRAFVPSSVGLISRLERSVGEEEKPDEQTNHRDIDA